MLKLTDNPAPLSPVAESIAELPGPWWVGHTRSRCEKAFAWDLYRAQVRYYLPMIERISVSGGRKRRAMHPLFPSYVFFCGDEVARYKALSTGRLCQVIEVTDQDRLVEQLDAVHRVIAAGGRPEPYPFVTLGQRCRVTAGPFADVEGVLVQQRRHQRFVLDVSILGQGASIEIDADLLEPIDLDTRDHAAAKQAAS
ncbi:MAG: transcription termination/antitermination NusG family protein [Planctomycetota bacterium]